MTASSRAADGRTQRGWDPRSRWSLRPAAVGILDAPPESGVRPRSVREPGGELMVAVIYFGRFCLGGGECQGSLVSGRPGPGAETGRN